MASKIVRKWSNMADEFTVQDIDPAIIPKIYVQSYAPQTTIEGVKFINLNNHVGEDGSFCEVVRLGLDGRIEGLPDFRLAQVNRTSQIKGSVKAWHLHYKQDELWYVPPPYTIFVGLWDLRKDSPTKGVANRVVLDGDKPQLMLIPHGVAHGSTVYEQDSANLYYFINRKFDIDYPDEQRIPWDYLGADFWQPKRD
jgi:dTDP-4-dehydrorhamnose 3,5-epimerase